MVRISDLQRQIQHPLTCADRKKCIFFFCWMVWNYKIHSNIKWRKPPAWSLHCTVYSFLVLPFIFMKSKNTNFSATPLVLLNKSHSSASSVELLFWYLNRPNRTKLPGGVMKQNFSPAHNGFSDIFNKNIIICLIHAAHFDVKWKTAALPARLSAAELDWATRSCQIE